MAKRHMLEGAADILSARNCQRATEKDRRNHSGLDWLAVDFPANEFRQNERTLGVGHEHEAPPLVVVIEIIVPCIAHIVVLEASR